MRTAHWMIVFLISLSFITSLYFYNAMPETIASHWNEHGEVDGYMPKSWALFLVPVMSVALLALLVLLPKIDPLRSNIKKFRKEYDRFLLILMFSLFYIHLLTILWNFGIKFNMIQVLTPAFSLIFYFAGILIEKSKRNWMIGIRTPWTMSSDIVWDKTHKLGGKLFKISGLIALLGLFFPDYAIILILVPIIIFATFSAIYSYLEYKKINKN
jgi:uncharacterized membrane protein